MRSCAVPQATPRGSTPLLNTLMSTLRQYLQARPLGSLPLLARMLADASEKIWGHKAAGQVGGGAGWGHDTVMWQRYRAVGSRAGRCSTISMQLGTLL
jgi:hypothetical protein